MIEGDFPALKASLWYWLIIVLVTSSPILYKNDIKDSFPGSLWKANSLLRGLVGGGRMPVIPTCREESLPKYKALLILLSVHSQLCESA